MTLHERAEPGLSAIRLAIEISCEWLNNCLHGTFLADCAAGVR